MTRTIPVFPLDLVLFPRQELPLRIFEPRYKQMVDDCMLGDGQFGVCLVDRSSDVSGWEAPRMTGTLAKITRCEDASPDGMQLLLEAVGRNPFHISRIIPPSIPRPGGYDPGSLDGHRAISEMNEGAGGGVMYLRAEAEMLPEIDGSVPLSRWEGLVDGWKRSAASRAGRDIDPRELDMLLERYYLRTETPTPDYVYSLAALCASAPEDLQPILESRDMEELLKRTGDLVG
ncbi:conserved hypothetical protein [Nitrosopumilaceae archaeon]|nr:LON peptidase substrate-binding domain-containing protein [Nitrosopumilus sp.]CAI9831120.1 conserved hypothetical protein [Nitrosopumilaceae archaeon]MDA7944883.1 LON peptidase substrate-binding domain-containing protein [Nitrosopumilus sp.]MDA7954507.1 LON peptidase substrate-binding domain-containing protein [Nitrosopumilus sp.]MDA7973494.1 LON peptidase substrate-binding domain-containing protein [Nitrosopumilus sp.]